MRLVLRVSARFEPTAWQSQSQRSLSFVQLCVWALTRGRGTRTMLIGTKWGVSPRWITEGEEKHVFSCIHVEIWDPALFFLSAPPPLSVKQIEAAMSVVCTHSQLMTWHIFYCQSVGVSLAWSNKYKRLIWCLDLGLFQRRLLWHTVNFLIWSSKGPSLKMKLELKWARKNKHRVKTSERPLRNVSNQIDDETFGLTYLHDK